METSEDIALSIKSGTYFVEARKWYKVKYLYPFIHRSFIFITLVLMLLLIIITFFTIYDLFPITTRFRYIVQLPSNTDINATIYRANQVLGNPFRSIVKILAENYVIQRESYNYTNLKDQFQYIRNKSTRALYKQFYDYMSLENLQSPILRYQKIATRQIQITSTVFSNDEQLSIYFRSKAKDNHMQVFEDIDWKADISFTVDRINPNAPSGAPFKFFVTDYKITLLRNNNVQQQKN